MAVLRAKKPNGTVRQPRDQQWQKATTTLRAEWKEGKDSVTWAQTQGLLGGSCQHVERGWLVRAEAVEGRWSPLETPPEAELGKEKLPGLSTPVALVFNKASQWLKLPGSQISREPGNWKFPVIEECQGYTNGKADWDLRGGEEDKCWNFLLWKMHW